MFFWNGVSQITFTQSVFFFLFLKWSFYKVDTEVAVLVFTEEIFGGPWSNLKYLLDPDAIQREEFCC